MFSKTRSLAGLPFQKKKKRANKFNFQTVYLPIDLIFPIHFFSCIFRFPSFLRVCVHALQRDAFRLILTRVNSVEIVVVAYTV